ncbi:MAG: hypothetical protein HY013_03120 [Candidatus Solibacter usitatus]|nr:hypothetical protein [Candidatus Solibacter usitatus]
MRHAASLRWLVWIACSCGFGLPNDLKPTFPGTEWERVKPESAGLSSKKLEALRGWLKTQKTTAMSVSAGGRIVFEYGDLARVSKVASVRKSILAMLFGASRHSCYGPRHEHERKQRCSVHPLPLFSGRSDSAEFYDRTSPAIADLGYQGYIAHEYSPVRDAIQSLEETLAMFDV